MMQQVKEGGRRSLNLNSVDPLKPEEPNGILKEEGEGSGGSSTANLVTIRLPWSAYALGWSKLSPCPRLFVGSFLNRLTNSILALDLVTPITSNPPKYQRASTSPTEGYPASRIACQPFQRGAAESGEEIVATATDAVRLWRAALPEADRQLAAIQAAEKGLVAPPPEMLLVAELASHQRPPCQRAPLTGLDWSAADPQLLVTSSVDTTCTLWDIAAAKVKTQLIAHDQPVLDVQFASPQSPYVFGSVGEDGSIRLFDLRALEQSTIVYETGSAGKTRPPLLRLRFNNVDSNYLAVLEQDNLHAAVLDVRMPGTQVAKLSGHSSAPTTLAWHPDSRNHLVTGGDDGRVLLWDLGAAIPSTAGSNHRFVVQPNRSYSMNQPVHNLEWSADSGRLAICSGSTLKIMGF